MDRRNFFKIVSGFVAGVCAAFLPKTKESITDEDYFWVETKTFPSLSAKDLVDAQFNPVIELQPNELFGGKVVGMCNFQGNLWIATEHNIYRIKGITA